jgi:hypothetical protein
MKAGFGKGKSIVEFGLSVMSHYLKNMLLTPGA